MDDVVLDVLFWTAAVCIWHLHERPAVATLELHGVLDFPGGYGAVVLFEASTARPPSENGSSDSEESLPSARVVFGTSEEEEDVEVEIEVEEEEEVEVEVEEEEPEEFEYILEEE